MAGSRPARRLQHLGPGGQSGRGTRGRPAAGACGAAAAGRRVPRARGPAQTARGIGRRGLPGRSVPPRPGSPAAVVRHRMPAGSAASGAGLPGLLPPAAGAGCATASHRRAGEGQPGRRMRLPPAACLTDVPAAPPAPPAVRRGWVSEKMASSSSMRWSAAAAHPLQRLAEGLDAPHGIRLGGGGPGRVGGLLLRRDAGQKA